MRDNRCFVLFLRRSRLAPCSDLPRRRPDLTASRQTLFPLKPISAVPCTGFVIVVDGVVIAILAAASVVDARSDV